MSRRGWLILFALFLSGTASAVATVATRLQGVWLASRSSNPLPAQSQGFWNHNGVLEACAGDDAGTCYPVAHPSPRVDAGADAGTAIGSGAAANVDTCSTGGVGSTCYRQLDVVKALKTTGVLAP